MPQLAHDAETLLLVHVLAQPTALAGQQGCCFHANGAFILDVEPKWAVYIADHFPTSQGLFHGQQIAVKLPPLRLVDCSELYAGQLEVVRVHVCGRHAGVPQSVPVQPGFPPIFPHGWGLPMGYPHPQRLFYWAIPAGKGVGLQRLHGFPDMVAHYTWC